MARIKDRLILGVLAGLGGNIAKTIIVEIAKRCNLAEIDGPEKAAGMLVPPYKIADPVGKAVGYLADNVVASMLGIVTVYGLSISGKDKAVLKGALTGQAMWAMFYGVLANMGATKVQPVSPKSVLSEFAGHTAYGALTAYLATRLGDPGLFKDKIPLSASSLTRSSMTRPAGQSRRQEGDMAPADAAPGFQDFPDRQQEPAPIH
ncbi:MAG: hypothetical protein K6T80_00900 [Firmicutes bacterium]|nr:hypothetical protein [Bacillota bacterium]